MKVKVKSSDLSRALKLCSGATDPIDQLRQCVEFCAEGNALSLSATNTSFSICVSFQATVEEEGTATVDGDMSYAVASKASGDCVITSDTHSLIIKTSGQTKLPDIHRHIPMVERVEGARVTCDALAFKSAINKVLYAVSEEQTRMVLTGVHVVSNGESLTFTALDGFRVAQKSIQCVGDNVDLIVPARIVTAICGAINGGELSISTNGNHISVCAESFEINATTLLGNYVDIATIIPTSFNTIALFTTSELRSLTESAIVGSGKTNLIRLHVEDGEMTVSANSEGADFSGSCGVSVQGETLDIAFNLKYLIQAISKIDTDQCEVKFTTRFAPAVVFPRTDGEADEFHLVLPVRTFT